MLSWEAYQQTDFILFAHDLLRPQTSRYHFDDRARLVLAGRDFVAAVAGAAHAAIHFAGSLCEQRHGRRVAGEDRARAGVSD